MFAITVAKLTEELPGIRLIEFTKDKSSGHPVLVEPITVLQDVLNRNLILSMNYELLKKSWIKAFSFLNY